MKIRRIAALAAAFASALPPSETLGASLYRYETPDYTLVAERTKSVPLLVQRLATLDRVLVTLTGQRSEPSGLPVRIIQIPAEWWERSVRPLGIHGVFLSGRFSHCILLDTPLEGRDLRPIVQREYTRLFLHDRTAHRHPLWYEHGLGLLVQNARIGDDSATVGHYHGPRSRDLLSAPYSLGEAKRMPILAVLEWKKRPRGYFHLQAWSMVHRGIVSDTRFGDQTRNYLLAAERFEPVEPAIRTHYAMSAAELDASMARYEDLEVPPRRIDFAPTAAVPIQGPARLSDAEVLYMVATAMLDGGNPPVAVRALTRELAKRSPGSTEHEILGMRVASLERDRTRFEELATATEPKLSSPTASRAYGLALAERIRIENESDTSAASMERALRILSASLQARPDDPEVAWAFAIVAIRADRDLDMAAAHLARASASIRRSGDLSMAMALVEGARGNTDAARRHLRDAVTHSRNDEQRMDAVRRLDSYEKESRP